MIFKNLAYYGHNSGGGGFLYHLFFVACAVALAFFLHKFLRNKFGK
jgi:hypothetical protein